MGCTQPSAREEVPVGTEVLLAEGAEEDETWASTIVQTANGPCLQIRAGIPGSPPAQFAICKSSLGPGSHVGGFNYVEGYRPRLLASGVVSNNVDRVELRLTCNAAPVAVDLSSQAEHRFSARFYSVQLPVGAEIHEVVGFAADGGIVSTVAANDTDPTRCAEAPPPVANPTPPRRE